MNSTTTWTREVDGTTYTAHATKTRPGVYEITEDLLADLMIRTGWTLMPGPSCDHCKDSPPVGHTCPRCKTVRA